MAISLQKGGNVNLSKGNPQLNKILIGLGWDVRSTDGVDFDLDAVAFLTGADGKVKGASNFVFYNNLKSGCGSVEHTGDNLTGAGDGDDETIKVSLQSVPANIEKIVIAVTIHEADIRHQNFGQVSSAFVRIVNDANNEEIARYDLSEDASTNTALIFGELYRHGGEWKFRAVGQGYNGGLPALLGQFGL